MSHETRRKKLQAYDDSRFQLSPADITSALDELGIAYRVSGNEANARCPYHDDRHASWGINLHTGLHHCFSCGAKGNFQMLLRHVRPGMDREAAASWVLSRAWKTPVFESVQRKPKTDDTTQEMNEAKLALFTRPPRWALRARGLDARSAAEFGIRWDKTGEWWITPVRDPKTHTLWGWQEKAERGRYFRNYPRDVRKSRTLFGLDCFAGPTARLVESPLDACRLRTAGLRGALASYGASVSTRQLVLLAGIAGELRLCLDDDGPGVARTEHIIDTFLSLPVSVFNYPVGAGKDPGDMTDDEILWADDHAIPSWRY